jgi:outer membrane protein
LLLAGGACQARDLLELMDLAIGSDPVYLGANAGVMGAEARTDQARAGLLPQLTANAGTNLNDRVYNTRKSGDPTTHDDYLSGSAQLQFKQSLWRQADIEAWRQSRRVLWQAEAQLGAAEQELFARVITAWFELLGTRDQALFAERQVAATQREWEMVARGAQLGSRGRAELEEVQAKRDRALAEADAAKEEVELKRAALEQIVGPLPPEKYAAATLPFLHPQARLADLDVDMLETWLAQVERTSPVLEAARLAREAARLEVRKQFSGHLPTLELVGSYGWNGQEVGGFPGQLGYDITQGTVGLQVSMPLYTGGGQSARVREARAQLEKAQQEFETARRDTLGSAKKAWFGWRAARSRAAAGAQSVKAAQAAFEVARRGRAHGLKTDKDVFLAEQQLREAERDFHKGRYDQVITFIRLKSTAGRLAIADIGALDAVLVDEVPLAGATAATRGVGP